MKGDKILRDILSDVLVDNFDIDHYEKTDKRFDIWLDEKNIQLFEDKYNNKVIAYSFGAYHEQGNPTLFCFCLRLHYICIRFYQTK